MNISKNPYLPSDNEIAIRNVRQPTRDFLKNRLLWSVGLSVASLIPFGAMIYVYHELPTGQIDRTTAFILIVCSLTIGTITFFAAVVAALPVILGGRITPVFWLAYVGLAHLLFFCEYPWSVVLANGLLMCSCGPAAATQILSKGSVLPVVLGTLSELDFHASRRLERRAELQLRQIAFEAVTEERTLVIN